MDEQQTGHHTHPPSDITSPRGLRGRIGLTGKQGVQGETGPPGVEPLLVRKATLSYLMLAFGFLLVVGFIEYRANQTDDRIEREVKALCEAGNTRSALQEQIFRDSLARIEVFDFHAIVNLPEPARTETAERIKRQNIEGNLKAIQRLPFVDCETGLLLKKTNGVEPR